MERNMHLLLVKNISGVARRAGGWPPQTLRQDTTAAGGRTISLKEIGPKSFKDFVPAPKPRNTTGTIHA